MSNINLLTGIYPIGQIPLDAKRYANTLAELSDLGASNFKAFYYHDRLKVLCLEDDKEYIWKESPGDVGLISGGFTYPADSITEGIDYSGKTFNFVESETNLFPIVESFGAIWSGTGLIYDCYADVYIIGEAVYSTLPGQVTLGPAPSTIGELRNDAIVVDVDGNFVVVPGVESINPIDPDIDESTQRLITIVQLTDNVLTPPGLKEVQLYDENAGEPNEFTATTTDLSTIDLESVNSPNKNLNHIEGVSVLDETQIILTDDAFNSFISMSSISFDIQTILESANISVFFRLGTDVVSSVVNIYPIQFGYQGALPNYQTIGIPMGYFDLINENYDNVVIEIKGFRQPNIDLIRLDNIRVVYGGNPFTSQINTYLNLDDTNDRDYSRKENYAPIVDSFERGLGLQKIPLFQDLYRGNAIIVGNVDYVADLERRIWATLYIIDNDLFDELVEGNVTHDVADANPRWDIYYIERLTPESIPTVGIKKGVADPNPQKPNLDNPVKQVKAGEKLFLGNEATTPPEIDVELIYDENLGQPSEWDVEANPNIIANANFGNGPYQGAVHIGVSDTSNPTTTETILLDNATPINYDSVSGTVSFALRMAGRMKNSARVNINFIDTANNLITPVVNFSRNELDSYGFDYRNPSEWYLISMSATEFDFSGTEFDKLAISFYDCPRASVDYIRYVSGVVTQPEPPSPGINPTGLEAIDEGNGIGWRLIGKNPAEFGNIGLYAVDFGLYNGADTNQGATGLLAFNMGEDNLASGIASATFGVGNANDGFTSFINGTYITSTANFSFSAGTRNVLTQSHSNAIGGGLLARGYYETVVGAANVDLGSDSGFNDAAGRMFVVGNGTMSAGSPPPANVRSDAFRVYKSGDVTAPSLTTTMIDADAYGLGKILVTKEWVNAQGFGTGTPTLQQVADEGNTSTTDIQMLGGKMQISNTGSFTATGGGPLEIDSDVSTIGTFSNSFFKVNRTVVDTTDFTFGIYNDIGLGSPTNGQQAVVNQNVATTTNSGDTGVIIGTYNDIRLRDTAVTTATLISGFENYVRNQDYGGTGTIGFVLGIRSKIIQDNANRTINNADGLSGYLDMDAGTINKWRGLQIGVNQTGGTISSGAYIELDTGIDEVQAKANGIKAIDSQPDLPSYFEGEIVSNTTIGEIDSEATGKILVTREWVNAQDFGGGERKRAVINYVDNTVAPPTEVSGDRYILDDTGASDAGWDGAAALDIVEFNGTTWVAETPTEGWVVYVDTLNLDYLYVDDGAPAWEARTSAAASLQDVTDVGNTTTLNIDVLSVNDLELFTQTGVDADNIGIGISALSNNTGTDSIGIGSFALQNSTALRSVAIGKRAGNSNTGAQMVGIGHEAMRNNTGAISTGIGSNALHDNTGESVTGVGAFCLTDNASDQVSGFGINTLQYNRNTYANAFGNNSLQNNTGNFTSAFGFESGKHNEGDNNTSLGYQTNLEFKDDVANLKNVAVAATDVDTVLNRITITAHGFGAISSYVNLKYSSTGTLIGGLAANSVYQFLIVDANTIEYVGSLSSIGTDTHTFTPQFVYDNVTVLGANAEPTKSNQVTLGDANVTEVTSVNANFIGNTFNSAYLGYINNDTVFIGNNAMASNTGSWCVAVGADALTSNTANFITAIGRRALQNNGGGIANTGIGHQALQNNTGNNNVGVGSSTLLNNTGTNNVGVGNSALEFNDGDNSAGIASSSLEYNVGNNVVGVGLKTGQINRGNDSVFVGNSAGRLNKDTGSVHVGMNAGVYNEGANNTSLGFHANSVFKDDVANLKDVADASTDVDTGLNRITIAAHGFGSNGTYVNLKYTTTGTSISGLFSTSIYQVLIVDANTIEFTGDVNLSSVGTDTHTFTPQFVYENTLALGANAEPTASNQVVLGDDNVTEVTSLNANFVGSSFNDLELFSQVGVDIDNIGIGTSALSGNTGTNCIGIGVSALGGNNQSGCVGIGWVAMNQNTGLNSVGIGDNSLRNNTGNYATSIGHNSGYNNTGSSATIIGRISGYNNVGSNATLIGVSSGYDNTGIALTGIGATSGQFNTGDYTTLLGSASGSSNTGDHCVGIGYQALTRNNTDYNTFVGNRINEYFPDDIANLKNVANAVTDIDHSLERFTINAHGFGTIGTNVNLRFTSTGTIPSGLTNNKIYNFNIIDANTLQLIDATITSTGTDTHTLTPQFKYSNVTAIGYNASPTASNQVALGDASVTEVVLGDGRHVALREDVDFFGTLIETVSDKDYKIVLKSPYGGTITETTTQCASGTATATFKINSTALGGTANSVSTAEQSQAHASANVFAAGDNIVITISANAACLDMSATLTFNRS